MSAARQVELLPAPHAPMVSPLSSPQGMLSPAEQGAAGTEAVGGLLPSCWALLFKEQEHLLDSMLSWLCQELAAIYGAQWWLAKSAEGIILHCLCICGPDRKLMAQTLQDCFQEHTAPLVHGIINTIAQQCSEEAQRLLQSRTVGDEDDDPVASSSYLTSSSSASSSSSSISFTTSFSTSRCTSSSRTSCRRTRRQAGTPSSSSCPAGSHREEEERPLAL